MKVRQMSSSSISTDISAVETIEHDAAAHLFGQQVEGIKTSGKSKNNSKADSVEVQPKGQLVKVLPKNKNTSRWWTECFVECPVSGFPVNLLPYPPFKFRLNTDPQSHTLIDPLTVVLEILATWKFVACGRALTKSDVDALDLHMKQCKLGPWRIGEAFKFKSGSDDMLAWQDTCSRARRKLEQVRKIQMNRSWSQEVAGARARKTSVPADANGDYSDHDSTQTAPEQQQQSASDEQEAVSYSKEAPRCKSDFNADATAYYCQGGHLETLQEYETVPYLPEPQVCIPAFNGEAGYYNPLQYIPVLVATQDACVMQASPESLQACTGGFNAHGMWPIETMQVSTPWASIPGTSYTADYMADLTPSWCPALENSTDEPQSLEAIPESLVPAEWMHIQKVMMRNVPHSYSKEMLLEDISEAGFGGCFDSVDLPLKHGTTSHKGYAFISFRTAAYAWSFKCCFEGRTLRHGKSGKFLTIVPAHPKGQRSGRLDQSGPSDVQHSKVEGSNECEVVPYVSTERNYCAYCGKKLDQDFVFCPFCGERLPPPQ